MIAVVILILKIIGIILLSLLGLLLFLLCLILFVPIRYRIIGHKGSQQDDYYCIVKLSYLLHIFSAIFKYDGKSQLVIRLFGFKLKKRNKDDSKVDKKDYISDSKKDNTHEDAKSAGQDKSQEVSGKVISQNVEIPTEADYTIDNNEPEPEQVASNDNTDYDKDTDSSCEKTSSESGNKDDKSLIDKIADFFEFLFDIPSRIFDYIDKLEDNVDSLADKFEKSQKKISNAINLYDDYRNKRAFGVIWAQIKYLLKSMAPRSSKGNICFGFDDPATTGQILAVLGMLAPFIPRKIKFNPSFDEVIMEGDIDLRGYLTCLQLLIILARLYFNKDVKRLWITIRKK